MNYSTDENVYGNDIYFWNNWAFQQHARTLASIVACIIMDIARRIPIWEICRPDIDRHYAQINYCKSNKRKILKKCVIDEVAVVGSHFRFDLTYV